MEIVSLSALDLSQWVDPPRDVHLLRPVSDFAESIADSFDVDPNTVGSELPWRKTHDKFRLRRSEVTLWGGANGSWKSMLVSDVMAYRIGRGDRVCMASLELPARINGWRMARQALASERPARGDVLAWARDWGDRLQIFDLVGRLDSKHALALMRYCAAVHRCNHFVLDNLTKVVSVDNDKSGEVQTFINDAVRIAIETGMHLHIVVHIRKPPDERTIPTRYEIRSTGSAVDQVTNVVMVWRNIPKERARDSGEDYDRSEADLIARVDKQNNGGWMGDVRLWFDPRSFRFSGGGYEETVPYWQSSSHGNIST